MAITHVEKYELDPDQLRAFQESVAQLSIGASRHGLGPIETKVLEAGERSTTVALSTPLPALGDYRPLARIEHLKGGKVSITRLVNEFVDFDEIRNERSHQRCDACGVKRRRRLTYLLRGPTGKVQVGSSCLAGFVGESDPRKALHQADVYAQARELAEQAAPKPDGDHSPNGKHPTVPTVDDFLTHVAAITREEGRFVPLSEAPLGEDAPTARLAIANYQLEQTGTDGGGESHWIAPTDDDRARATELADEFRRAIDENASPAGYERRLRNLLDKDFAWPAYQGVLATLFFVKADPAKVKEINESRQSARTEWLGEVGDKVKVKVTVDRISKPVPSKYGEQVPHGLIDDEGHSITWFATNRTLLLGGRYELDGEIRSRRKFRRTFITVVFKCRVREIES